MIARLSRAAVIIGIVGAALNYLGILASPPLATWLVVIVVGAVCTAIFRRPSD